LAVTDAIKSIATFGYTERKRALVLEQRLKSLLDSQTSGAGVQSFSTTQGDQDRPPTAFKQNVIALRTLAETQPWVRAAIKIYRDRVAGAEWKVVPYDPTKPMDKRVARDVEALLDDPTPKNTPYATLKKMQMEDYLVLGHGVIEKKLRKDLTPYQLDIIDAATFAFVKDWNGDPAKPHYAVIDPASRKVRRYLADQQAMVLFNTMRSYDPLGLSHVEVLWKALVSLTDGDDFLKQQVMNPVPAGYLALGEGSTPTQADQARSQMMALKYPFLIGSGLKGAQWIPFTAAPKDLQILEAQEWFVREICTVFGLSTTDLALAVDTSRSNTETLQTMTSEALLNTLEDVRDLENQELVLQHGPVDEHNVMIDYPALNQRDESVQTDIAQKQTGNNTASINEGRTALGLDRLEMPIADEILVQVPSGPPVPLSVLNSQYFAKQQSGTQNRQGFSKRR
jgi:hypothetical protein